MKKVVREKHNHSNSKSNKRFRRGFFFRIGVSKVFLYCFVGILFVLVGVFGVQKLLFPQIHLNGGRKIVVSYQANYKEKGYTASYLGKDVTEEVKVVGKVDTSKLGEYSITYQVGGGFFKGKAVRVVSVLDREKPTMELTKDDFYVCPGSKVVAEKVKAVDNYDGDISKKVKSVIQKDKIIYSVSDSSGNKQEIAKKIVFQDIEAPVLTLEGEETIDMYVGGEYGEPGYQVTDNCDENISEKVKIDGSVNSSEVGEYELIYKVKDDAGNESSATRKVRVNEIHRNGVVYLTFDDGPNSGTTDVILDILKEEGVKATFFVTSKGPDELIVREYNEGHTVALHTSSHDYATVYASDDAFFADLQTVHDRVQNLTGVDSRIIRFPGGSSNTISRSYSEGIMSRITQEVLNRGYKYYDWNISSGDAGSTTDPNQVYLNVVNNLRRDRPNMVLMHDIKPYTRDALRNIIHYCKENGYPMEKITYHTEMVTQRVNN